MSVEVAQWDGSNDTNWLFPIVVRFVGKSTFANINVFPPPPLLLSFLVLLVFFWSFS